MCIKRRRKNNIKSQISDRTAPYQLQQDATPTESSRDPALRTAEESALPKTTTEIKVRSMSQLMSQQKQSSITTSQPTYNNNNNNSTCSPKLRIMKYTKENICFVDDNNNNNNENNNNDNNTVDVTGGKTAENEIGSPIQIHGAQSTRNIERKFEAPNPAKFEKAEKKPQQQVHQNQNQQQVAAAKSLETHTNTQEEIKMDKTQDVPAESAPATTQAASKLQIHHRKQQHQQPPHQPPLQSPPPLQNQNNNERMKQFRKRREGEKAKIPAAPQKTATIDCKEITTPLMTDFLNKKVEKENNFEELSRIPVVKTANIKHERFPYSNQVQQDTMDGISSNFSATIEVPEELLAPEVEQEMKNKRMSFSSKKLKKKAKKKATKEEDATQESSKKVKPKR